MILSLYSYEDSREIDRETIARGFPEIQLMGQAALASLHALLPEIRESNGRIVIFAGSGNNGGDGLAFAYMASAFAEQIEVYHSVSKTPASQFYETMARSVGIQFRNPSEFDPANYGEEDIFLEALLGTGQTQTPRGEATEILEKIKQNRKPRLVSLDVPAGLCEDTQSRFSEKNPEHYPLPDEIHCYGTAKLPLYMNSDLVLSRIKVLPMGFFPFRPSNDLLYTGVLEKEFFLKSAGQHKYQAGSAFFIAPSHGMEGAGILSIKAFFAAGGGIAKAAVFSSEARILLTSASPTIMFSNLEEVDGVNASSIVIGPGLAAVDLNRYREKILRLLIEASPKVNVVILDALAAGLVLEKDYPAELKTKTLCTPHEGEWARLGGPSVRTAAGLRAAKQFAKQLGVHILVKGSVTVYLDPNSEKSLFFSRPNASLSVAGSGDALAGILAASFSRQRETEVSFETKLTQGLCLHSDVAASRTHPMSEEFPDLIRLLLEK